MMWWMMRRGKGERKMDVEEYRNERCEEDHG